MTVHALKDHLRTPAEREMRQALELIRDAAQNAESPETALIWIAALCDTTLRHAGMERAR